MVVEHDSEFFFFRVVGGGGTNLWEDCVRKGRKNLWQIKYADPSASVKW